MILLDGHPLSTVIVETLGDALPELDDAFYHSLQNGSRIGLAYFTDVYIETHPLLYGCVFGTLSLCH